jgi:hypothetical protein
MHIKDVIILILLVLTLLLGYNYFFRNKETVHSYYNHEDIVRFEKDTLIIVEKYIEKINKNKIDIIKLKNNVQKNKLYIKNNEEIDSISSYIPVDSIIQLFRSTEL